jgi:hypothetical protein
MNVVCIDCNGLDRTRLPQVMVQRWVLMKSMVLQNVGKILGFLLLSKRVVYTK